MNGEWVKCKEISSSNAVWYHKKTHEVSFTNPNELQLVQDAESARFDKFKTSRSTIDEILGTNFNFEENPNIKHIVKQHSWLNDFKQDEIDYIYPRYFSTSRMELLTHGYIRQNWIFITDLAQLIVNYVGMYKFNNLKNTSNQKNSRHNDINCILIKIALPSEYSKHRKYCLIRWDINSNGTANDFICKCIMKLDAAHEEKVNAIAKKKDFVIKQVGYEKYIYGDILLINFESIQRLIYSKDYQCNNEIVFKLIDIKNSMREIENKQKNTIDVSVTNENTKNNEKIENNINGQETPTASATKDTSIKTLFLSEMDSFPWGISIIGVTNIIYLSQYLKYEHNMNRVYVECELVIGDQIIPKSTLKTKIKCVSHQVYFSHTPIRTYYIRYAQIPNETILNLIVYGIIEDDINSEKDKENQSESKEKDKNKETKDAVPLAWTRMRLFDDNGEMVKGKHLLNLWEIDDVEDDIYRKLTNDKHNNSKENFRVCGTICQPPKRYIQEKLDKGSQCQLLIKFDTFCDMKIVKSKYTQLNSKIMKTKKIAIRKSVTTTPDQDISKLEDEKTKEKEKEKEKDETQTQTQDNHIHTKVQGLIKRHHDIFDSNFFENNTVNNGYRVSDFKLFCRDRIQIWNKRDILCNNWKSLPFILRCINWYDIEQVVEAHEYLDKCHLQLNNDDDDDGVDDVNIVNIIPYIRLLNHDFGDCKVKDFALRLLSILNDRLLNLILVPLIECLKFDYFDQLSKFLLLRSIKSPYTIGHYFFWNIKSQLNSINGASLTNINKYYYSKFSQLLKIYLSYENVIHVEQYYYQLQMIKSLKKIVTNKYKLFCPRPANDSVDGKDDREDDEIKVDDKKQSLLEKYLKNCQQQSQIQNKAYTIALNPYIRVKSIKLDKCRCYMKRLNKTQHLRVINLVFENGDDVADDVYLSFRVVCRAKSIIKLTQTNNDDETTKSKKKQQKRKRDKLLHNTHQQMFIPNLLSLINHIWQQNGLYLPDIGYDYQTIIVDADYSKSDNNNANIYSMSMSRSLHIKNAQMIRSILKNHDFGGRYNKSAIYNYLEKYSGAYSADSIKDVQSRFTKCCAALNISNFILGINKSITGVGNDVVVTKDGYVYNSNFDTVLGRNPSIIFFRSFGGDPSRYMTFSSTMKGVIDGNRKKSVNYDNFVNLCSDAWEVFRVGYNYQRILIVLLSILMDKNNIDDLDLICQSTKVLKMNSRKSDRLVKRQYVDYLLKKSARQLSYVQPYQFDMFRHHR